MHFLALGSLLLAGASGSLATCTTNCSLASSDNSVLQFAWALQVFTDSWYTSIPLNQSIISSFPNSSSVNYAYNIQALQRQNRWSTRAIQQLGASSPGFQPVKCSYSYPKVSNGTEFVQTAWEVESTVSGAFIGLAAYTQAPELSFLIARLATEHGVRAAYIASESKSMVFQTNTTSYIQPYTPDQILEKGQGLGKLGNYLGNCTKAPVAPCNKVVVIGPLIANLTEPSASAAASSSAAALSSAFDTSTPPISGFAAASSGAFLHGSASSPASASASPSST